MSFITLQAKAVRSTLRRSRPISFATARGLAGPLSLLINSLLELEAIMNFMNLSRLPRGTVHGISFVDYSSGAETEMDSAMNNACEGLDDIICIIVRWTLMGTLLVDSYILA